MTDDIAKNLKKLARETETAITKSLLRWKYRKDGGEPPEEEELSRRSRQIAEEARRTMIRSGKSVWNELKRIYSKDRPADDGEDG